MNVLDFFELSSEPFANSPDGRFFFESAQHAQVMARLRYVTDSMKGLAIVVGDIGAGKTTLARRFMEMLPEDEYEAALLVVIHSAVTSDWLLTKIAMQLGVEQPAPDKVTLLGQLYARLREIHDSARRAVVLIDEAQMLQSREIMEELRGLLNLEMPGRKLISLVFFGLPDVETTLRLDPPLQQRVALKVHLQALPASSTEEYIKHRLKVAGARTMPFSREAVAAVHRFSRGTPRLINTICDNALLEAYLLKRRLVSEEIINTVVTDLGLAQPAAAPMPPAAAPSRAATASARDPLDPRLGPAQRQTPAPTRAPAAPGPAAGAPRQAAVVRPPGAVVRPPGQAAPPAATRPGAGASPRQGPAGGGAPQPRPTPPQAPPRVAPASTTQKGMLGELDEFDELLSGLDRP